MRCRRCTVSRRSVACCALLGGLLGLAAVAAAAPQITRDEIIDIAKGGVGSRYVWGGTCWDPANRGWKGADCSGFVTKTWQIPERSATTACVPHYYTTSSFLNARTHWTSISRNDLIRGDALVYNSGSAGHIVLYESGDKWGSHSVYEARGSAYGIVHRVKTSDAKYQARRRHDLVTPIPKLPQVTIVSRILSISGQARDFCKRGGSKAIFDWKVGQQAEVQIDVKNGGSASALDLRVKVWAEEPYLEVTRWNIYSDWKSSSFALNDTDGMQSLPHASPPKTFTLELGALGVGETKRIKLRVLARRFSIGKADHPDVRAWVSQIKDLYAKAGFTSAPTNVGDSQKHNGGDLKTYVQTDVLATKETCDEQDNDCDGEVDEGACEAPAVEEPSGAEQQPGITEGGTLGATDTSREIGDNQIYGGCAVTGGRAPDPPLLALLLALLIRRRRRAAPPRSSRRG